MERLTREQMVTEFGEPGVENPKLLDLISVDPATDKVVLTMIERRPWGDSDRQFTQIEEKINRYLGYVLEGFLAEQHPEYEGKRVQIRLQCAEEPHGEAARFVAAATHAIQAEGLDFAVIVAPPGMKPRYFATPDDFRAWLAPNHRKASELLVGFHKVGSGKPSITWPESVDQALCFGWIDGVRRSLGATSYTIRFTPRRPRSIWSAVNTRRFAVLDAQGLVAAAGRAAFGARQAHRSGVYSFEQAKPPRLSAAYSRELRANARAWAFFKSRPPWYQRTATHWVVSAKKPETRDRRLRTLIADSAAGRTIGPLTRPGA